MGKINASLYDRIVIENKKKKQKNMEIEDILS